MKEVILSRPLRKGGFAGCLEPAKANSIQREFKPKCKKVKERGGGGEMSANGLSLSRLRHRKTVPASQEILMLIVILILA